MLGAKVTGIVYGSCTGFTPAAGVTPAAAAIIATAILAKFAFGPLDFDLDFGSALGAASPPADA